MQNFGYTIKTSYYCIQSIINKTIKLLRLMLYEITKVTRIDSMHENKEHYATIDCSREDLIVKIIPMLNKLVHITNLNTKLIKSNKVILFHIKAIKGLNVVDIVTKLVGDITDVIDDYNRKAVLANSRTKQLNKINKQDEYKGIIKLFNMKDFDNPFISFTDVGHDLMSDTLVAIGSLEIIK